MTDDTCREAVSKALAVGSALLTLSFTFSTICTRAGNCQGAGLLLSASRSMLYLC